MGKVLMTAVLLALFGGCSANRGGSMIEEGKTVKMHYVLSVEGKVVEDTHTGEPFQFVQGSPGMIRGVQDEVQGLRPGEQKNFIVRPENAFGPRVSEAVVQVARENLPQGAEIQPGMVLSATAQDGQPLRGVVLEVREENAVVDFNHPLAGKELYFAIEIVEVS